MRKDSLSGSASLAMRESSEARVEAEVMQELVTLLAGRLRAEKERAEDLARRLGAAEERLAVLESRNYGVLGGFFGD